MNRLGDRLIDILLGWLLIAGTLATAALLGVAMWLLMAAVAGAHEAPAGWRYPYNCCHDNDCRPVGGPSGDRHGITITFAPEGGYRISTTGETIMPGDSRLKPSPDGEFHWCSVGGSDTGSTLCLFVPPLGF